MHFLWYVQLITFIARYAFKLRIKIFIKIYILHPSSRHSDTLLNKCFILYVCVCVCVWGGGCFSAERWVFSLIRENVTFFGIIYMYNIKRGFWRWSSSAVLLLGIATREVYMDGKNKKAQ